MNNFFTKNFTKDIGIDLGTANTLVYVKTKGIVINEPSVVAINNRTKQILAIGSDAQAMVGRTPGHITAARPLVDGVVSDFEVTEAMLRYFLDKVHAGSPGLLRRSRVVVGIPAGATEVEKRAVHDAAKSAGASEAYLIEEPIAAAIGARLPVQDATGSMVVDIGGGTTEIAVISLGGIVAAHSLRIAGDKLNSAIIDYVREVAGLLIGERTAENLKISIGSALEMVEPMSASARGRDTATGLPKEIILTDQHIREAMSPVVKNIASAVKAIVEVVPPEVISDLWKRGILLTGGGAMLRGLDKLLSDTTNMPVSIADEPLTCVARGAGAVAEDLENLREMLVSVDTPIRAQ